jgi:hypothetical protein
MRAFARRERPHPGAQLSLFEAADGWRYSLWVTNLPTSLRGWQAGPAYIDAAHRVHARVEDCVRTGKDTGIGKFPSRASPSTRCSWPPLDCRHPAGLAAAAGPRRTPGQSRAQDPALRILHSGARLTRSGRRRRLKISATWPWAPAIVTAWDRITALPQAP